MTKKVFTIIVILIVIGGGLTAYLIYYYRNKSPLPGCLDTPFTHSPVNLTRISSIVPLGNLNPPGHTFPTDHMYFYTNTTMFPEGFAIYAPGNLTIRAISKVEYSHPYLNITEDYSIDFKVCKDVSGRYGHVNNLSDYLWNIIQGFGTEYGDYVDSWQVAGDNYTAYRKILDLKVSAGQALGVAGWAGGFDFWLKDERVTLSWVNTDWTQEFQNTVCPLAYFTTDLKTAMELKLTDWSGIPVYPANYCGRIEFDVPNTAQGIWTRHDYVDRAEDYGLSLVYNNFNASQGAISIGYAGNSSWDSQVYTFNPTEEGYSNRKFDEVTADGHIYYYLCDQFLSGANYTKVILLKMVTNQQLRLQFIDYGIVPIPLNPTLLWNESNSILYLR
ncbi:MAG: hypothetical protein ACTSQQ_07295 [Candidatus Helarchaeota archaeon]